MTCDAPALACWLLCESRMKLAAAALLLFVGCTSDSSTTKNSALTAPPGACGGAEVNVIAVDSAPSGTVILRIDRPGQHTLVLSAREATTWKVSAAPGVDITAIYAVGLHAQKVTGMTGVKLTSDSMDTTGTYACGYGAGCSVDGLMKLTGKLFRPGADSFHGCLTASQFHMGEDFSTSSDCTGAQDPQTSWIDGCINHAAGDPCGVPIIL